MFNWWMFKKMFNWFYSLIFNSQKFHKVLFSFLKISFCASVERKIFWMSTGKIYRFLISLQGEGGGECTSSVVVITWPSRPISSFKANVFLKKQILFSVFISFSMAVAADQLDEILSFKLLGIMRYNELTENMQGIYQHVSTHS